MGPPLFFLLPLLLRCEASGDTAGRVPRQSKLETEQAVPVPSPAYPYSDQRALFRREEARSIARERNRVDSLKFQDTPIPTPQPPASCDGCPCNDATHVRRFGWQQVTCSSTQCGSCTFGGLDQCCEPRQSCNHYTCPIHTLGKKGGSNLCIAANCGFKEDVELCCLVKSRCDTMECPERYTNKVNEAELDCQSNPCDTDDEQDQLTCCERKATCASYNDGNGCPEDHRVWVSAGESVSVKMVLRLNAHLIDCAKQTCFADIDLDTCCEERSLCTEMNCQDTHRGFALRFDASVLWCVGRHCGGQTDLATCCYDATDLAEVRSQETLRANAVTKAPTASPPATA